MAETSPIHTRPGEMLQQLIRFDTTNPPGNEVLAIDYLDGLLTDAGIATRRIARDPQRPNLLARLKGRGDAPPLLLYGHVDVVSTVGQRWTHPPFSGDLIDGYIWGRGALDMKSGVAMMTAAFMRAAAEGTDLPGDVILCIVSDEEDGGDWGAKFLTEQHAHEFEGVRYAIGEFGGFSLNLRGVKFYPIMVAEKQWSHLRAWVRGPAGHGSLPKRGGAAAKLAHALTALDRTRTPVHVTPVTRDMINGIADGIGGFEGILLRQLLNPALSDRFLGMLGTAAEVFEPLLRNTANATVFRGGDKVNVVPGEIMFELDGRLLPGFKPADLIAELQAIVGPDVEFELVRHDPGPEKIDMALFDTLAGILIEHDPSGKPLPLLLGGVTDGRFFAQLGIQTYGFLPMQLPPDLNFAGTIHAADERIPADALPFGTEMIFRALQRFHRTR